MELNRVAFIPVRGGSKSIPLKNIKPLAGKPLCHWVIEAALACDLIDKVFLCTDSAEIRESVEHFRSSRFEIIDRSPETASDTASTESALLEFSQKIQANEYVLIQATSPLLTGQDLEKGIKKFLEYGYDSLLSVVKQKRFYWIEKNECAQPLNYNPINRPRRQDFDGCFVENGAFYIMRREGLVSNSSRLYGKIGISEMNEKTYFEIDEPSDWDILTIFLSSGDSKRP